MKQSTFLQPSWTHSRENFPGYVYPSTMDSSVDYFPDSFATMEDSDFSVESFLSTLFCDDNSDEFSLLDGGTVQGFGWEDVRELLNENNKEEFSPDTVLEPPVAERPCASLESSQTSLGEFPGSDTDGDEDHTMRQRRPCCLLKAYAEAMENGQRELESVIAERKLEKINPIGDASERASYHLLQPLENSGSYLREESRKNIKKAYKVFYQSFVYVRFAHFIANAAILESVPDDIDRVVIIDFDIGEAVQWAPVVEYIGNHKQVALKIICIKAEDECQFGETQKRLYDHARPFGLNLQVEQMNLDELMTELKRVRKTSRSRDWFAFNCSVGLPNTGKGQRRDQAVQFVNSAKEFLAEYTNHRGILTFSDAEAMQRPETCSGFVSFFESYLMHFQAVLDSMQSNFPDHLAEARIAMETLFVAPYICSSSWLHQWKKRDESLDIGRGNVLQGVKLSQGSISEAKEMVNEGNSSYKVKVERGKQNEMVLEWKGTPLVRISCWK